MSFTNLTKQFISKTYGGLLHTANIPISGSNNPSVYDGLGNKTPLNISSNKVSIDGTLAANNLDISIINIIFPVGSVYFSTNNLNPVTRFANTNWELISQGKFIAGVGTGTDKNNTSSFISPGNDINVGEYNHVLSIQEMPQHAHNITIHGDSSTVGGNIQSGTGGFISNNASTQFNGFNQPHNNVPPYFGLYIWQRIS